MSDNMPSPVSFESKPHYLLLDALRGVAALLVLWYHVFEGFATSPLDQRFNHGYLAVDFFFVLSGFVVGYAYDDRWGRMRIGQFLKRRFVRLHPMVVIAALIGAVSFLFQGSVKWDGSGVSLQWVVVALLLSLFLLPVFPGMQTEVRGNGEMFPLNGPSWSLFFEYIGNILYALFIHRLSTHRLKILVFLSGVGLLVFAVFFSEYRMLGVGWSLGGNNFVGGMLRLLFSYSAGLLLSRVFKPRRVRGSFWWCSALLVVLFTMPYVGGEQYMWMNGLYDSLCVIIVFPAIVYLGASGTVSSGGSKAFCKFLGDISYPVYIVHYPFMYLFYAWVWKNELPFSEAWHVALCVIAVSIGVAYLFLKCYDEPVRKFLSTHWLSKDVRR